MMRRLIQTPVHRRPCRRAISLTPECMDSHRYGSGEAVRCRLDGETSTSSQLHTPHTILPTMPYGIEIQGVSTRKLSSEAIQALSRRDGGTNNDFFGSSSPINQVSGDVMLLNPLLGLGGHMKSTTTSIAPMELCKAISALNQESNESITDHDGSIEDTKADFGEIDTSSTHINSQESEQCMDTVNNQEPEETIITESAIETSLNCEEESDKHTKEDEDNIDAVKQRLREKLDKELNQDGEKRWFQKVMKIFEQERSSPHELLDDKQLVDMYYHLLQIHSPSSWHVLKHYVERCKEKGRLVNLSMYYSLIHQIRPIDDSTKLKPANYMSPGQTKWLVYEITRHIKNEYSDGKKRVYQYLLLPELVMAVSENKGHDIRPLAIPIMHYILDNKFPVLHPDLYEYILSKGRRADSSDNDIFPYHRVLSELISSGHTPRPKSVNNVLQCYYPFSDLKAAHEILSLIQKLHVGDEGTPSAGSYRVDLGTLELISRASARKDINLNLLVWDLVEQYGYSPTPGLFEDVIMGFAATLQDENAFSALKDMEKSGFVVHPDILSYMALKISWNEKRLNHCYKMLSWHRNDHVRSVHSFNALLAAYGMKRDINNAFFVYEEMPRFDIQPDASTFTFLMDALYIDTKDRFPYTPGQDPQYNSQDVDDVVGASHIILYAMEESGIQKTNHFYHEYIRLLCTIGLHEEAKLVLEEAISAGTPLPKATLFMLATRFADVGEFDNAQAIADLSLAAGCGKFPTLHSRIRRMRGMEKKSDEDISNIE